MAGIAHPDDVASAITSPLEGLRVGYAPLSASLEQPGDRRRFPFYAERRGLDFEFRDTGALAGDTQKFNVHGALSALPTDVL